MDVRKELKRDMERLAGRSMLKGREEKCEGRMESLRLTCGKSRRPFRSAVMSY